jgi:transposase
VYTIYTMSFVRKIKRGERTYLAEVENQWKDGRCVQKHIRYIGKEVDEKVILASSISNLEVTEIKLFGPLLVLDSLAKGIELEAILGEYGKEILSMVYAHCLDFKSVNKMTQWYERTDLPFILSHDALTKDRLYSAMDSIEYLQAENIQRTIFDKVIDHYKVPVTGIVYDVTNTYLYGNKCPIGKRGHSKDGQGEHPLIQIGLAVTKNEGIPICHKVLDGNVHDARMFQDFVTDFHRYKTNGGLFVYDRGISSARNLKDIKALGWETLCGLPIRGTLAETVRAFKEQKTFVTIDNRVQLKNSTFYVCSIPHTIDDIHGILAVCFNGAQQHALQESRYDEIQNAKELLSQKKAIKPGLEKYFDAKGDILSHVVAQAEEFDGFSCLFATKELTKEECIKLYFGKNIIERSFRTLKGIVCLQPIRHWLYNRVTAHVFICYLSYLLLSLLEHHLRKIPMTADEALEELSSMYKVYLRDAKKNFHLSRVVTLTTKQELIVKRVNKALLKS